MADRYYAESMPCKPCIHQFFLHKVDDARFA